MAADKQYIYNLFNLKNRVAIVTGGLGKLGTEFTEALVKANARVVIFDVASKPNRKLTHLEKKYSILVLKVDITKEKEVERAIKMVEKKWAVPSILINNAGWKASPNEPSRASVPFVDYPMDVWDDVFRINVTGAAICAKYFARRLIATRTKGTIVNVASHYGLVSADQRIYDYKKKTGKKQFVKDASYGASKAGLIALTKDLATQWAENGIRVVALAPGGVFNPKSDKKFVENYSSRVPLNRMAALNEYQGAIIFLASDASSYMTGTTLIVDGGWTAW